MIVFPVLIPVQNFLFPGTGRENLKCHGKGRDGKFEACIPGNHGKREFPLTPVSWCSRSKQLDFKVLNLPPTTREKDDVLETEAEGRDADDELAARLEAGEVVSLGGKVADF